MADRNALTTNTSNLATATLDQAPVTGTDVGNKRSLDTVVLNTVTVTPSDEAISAIIESTNASIDTSVNTVRVQNAKWFRLYMDDGDTDTIYWNMVTGVGSVTADNSTKLTRWKDVTFEADSGELLDITINIAAATGTSRIRVQAIGRTGTTPTITFA